MLREPLNDSVSPEGPGLPRRGVSELFRGSL